MSWVVRQSHRERYRQVVMTHYECKKCLSQYDLLDMDRDSGICVNCRLDETYTIIKLVAEKYQRPRCCSCKGSSVDGQHVKFWFIYKWSKISGGFGPTWIHKKWLDPVGSAKAFLCVSCITGIRNRWQRSAKIGFAVCIPIMLFGLHGCLQERGDMGFSWMLIVLPFIPLVVIGVADSTQKDIRTIGEHVWRAIRIESIASGAHEAIYGLDLCGGSVSSNYDQLPRKIRILDTNVSVHANALRSSPVIAELHFGDDVLFVRDQYPWKGIALPGDKSGYIHHTVKFYQFRTVALDQTGVNVHEKPACDSKIIFSYACGAKFTIVSEAERGDMCWLQVHDISGLEGFVPASTKVKVSRFCRDDD